MYFYSSIPLIKFQDLVSTLPEGEAKIDQCIRAAEVTLVNTGPEGRGIIQQEIHSLNTDWSGYQSDLTDTKSRLEIGLGQWQHYDATYEALLTWVKETERKVKDFCLVSTLEDKRSQARKYQVTLY